MTQEIVNYIVAILPSIISVLSVISTVLVVIKRIADLLNSNNNQMIKILETLRDNILDQAEQDKETRKNIEALCMRMDQLEEKVVVKKVKE